MLSSNETSVIKLCLHVTEAHAAAVVTSLHWSAAVGQQHSVLRCCLYPRFITSDEGGGKCFCLCSFVCMSVCLSVGKITQKRVHGFG